MDSLNSQNHVLPRSSWSLWTILALAFMGTGTAFPATPSPENLPVPILPTKPPHSSTLPLPQRQLQRQPQASRTRGNVRRRGKRVFHRRLQPGPKAHAALMAQDDDESTVLPGTPLPGTGRPLEQYGPIQKGIELGRQQRKHTGNQPDKHGKQEDPKGAGGKDTGGKGKGGTKDKQTKGTDLAQEEAYSTEFPSEQYHYKSKAAKGASKKGVKGKKYAPTELQYFEAGVLLELVHAQELTDLDLQQLEQVVVETYNSLSEFDCDLQGRQFTAVTMDPTQTATGYIFHLQGQCYNCDPDKVHVFAHEDQVYDEGMIEMMMTMDEGVGTETLQPSASTTSEESNATETTGGNLNMTGGVPDTPAVNGTDDTTPEGTNGTLPETMETPTPSENETTSAPTLSEPPAGGNTTPAARTRGGGNRLRKKTKTFSRYRSRLVRSEDDLPAAVEPAFSYGTSAQSRATYHQNEKRPRQLQHHHGAVNRSPDTDAREYAEEEEDRAGHMDYEDDPSIGLLMPYKHTSKKSKSAKDNRKGSKKSKGSMGYYSDGDCSNEYATHRAPTEEEFVTALNEVTDALLLQYNKLSATSAVQVRREPCSTDEEEFESSLAIEFMGSQDQSLSLIPFVEKTILHSYNHLQATHSCDIPHFREMTGVVLEGISPGPSLNTFLATFDVTGTCREEGCNQTATFFDPLDQGRRNRLLGDHTRMLEDGLDFTSTGSSAEGDDQIYHEVCYCPFKVDEFGPPFLSDLEAVLNRLLKEAHEDGSLEPKASVVNVKEGTEVATSTDDEVAYDPSPVPDSDGSLSMDSFVIVQFFGDKSLVTEQEVNEINSSMPLIYNNLQLNAFCDPLSRSLTSAVLQSVDAGPTEDSFLLGFAWEGKCQDCSSSDFFFAPSGQPLVPCGSDKVQGAPIIEDFENDLFQAILALRSTGDLVNIQASGDAVEVLPGGTAAPILAPAPRPQAPQPTMPTMPTMPLRKGRNASPSLTKPFTSQAPSPYPTWIGTETEEPIPGN